MTSPVVLDDLPTAGPISAGDYFLIRQGLTDYKVTAAVVQTVSFAGLTLISPIISDSILINRSGVNYYTTFGQVGFPVGTKMWFYQGTPPSTNWQVIPGTGDRLLAVADPTPVIGTNYKSIPQTFAGNQGGTWQQVGWALTIAQMPSHTHTYKLYEDSVGNNSGEQGGRRAVTDSETTTPPKTNSVGSGAQHDHGNYLETSGKCRHTMQ